MNQKQIGTVLIIIAVLTGILTFLAKAEQDEVIRTQVMQTGTCMLDDGSCLHADRDWTMIALGSVVTLSLLVLGIYLVFFDKTQKELAKTQEKVTEALRDAKTAEKTRDEFQAFLKGFSKDEQSILKAVHDQDGILQSTLRYKSGIAKAKLSLMLAELEKRGFIARKVKGKSKQVFLRN